MDSRGRIRRWGVRFDLNLNDNVQRSFYYTGWYERAFLRFLRDELEPEDTYIDVGAHVGIDAAYVANFVPAGTVAAFEPAPDAVSSLRHSAGSRDNVTVIPVALGDRAGQAILRANPKWHREDAATRSRFTAGPPIYTVPLVRFDDWANDLTRMDVVKIDAEGSELDVLRGMEHSLTRLQPRVVAVEMYRPYLAAAGWTEKELVALLDALGYARERTIGDNAIFRLRTASGSTPRSREAKPRLHASRRHVALYLAAASVAVLAWLGRAAILQNDNVASRPLDFHRGVWALLFPGCVLAACILACAFPLLRRREHVRAVAGFIPDCLVLVGRLLRDRRLRRREKLLLVVFLGYLAMPIDPIPDFIPVVGQLDDAFFLAFVLRRLVRKGRGPLLREHWPGPDASLRLVLHLAGV
jgi:FkbM family methyltransferase